jgi:hypothetical protein
MQSLILGPLYSVGFILLLSLRFRARGMFGRTNSFEFGLRNESFVLIYEMSGAKTPGHFAGPFVFDLFGEAKSISKSFLF